MVNLHVWTIGGLPLEIAVRSTQPNRLRPFAFAVAGERVPLEAVHCPDGHFAFMPPAALVADLTVAGPNWDGRFLAIGLAHLLHPGNELQFWGWTYRLTGGGSPVTQGTDWRGEPIVCDADGWVAWPRRRRDFADLVAVPDLLFLELRSSPTGTCSPAADVAVASAHGGKR